MDVEDGLEGSSSGRDSEDVNVEGSVDREGVESSRVSGSKRAGRVIGLRREELYKKSVVQTVQPIRI